MECVQVCCKAVPGGPGEGVFYLGKSFRYRDGKSIPKNKVASLSHQELENRIEHILVAWNGSIFIVLDHCTGGGVRDLARKYRGIDASSAIALLGETRQIEEESQDDFCDSVTKCKVCQKPVVVLKMDQPRNLCLSCFSEDKKCLQ